MKDNADILTLFDEVQLLKKEIVQLNKKMESGISMLKEREQSLDELQELIKENQNDLDGNKDASSISEIDFLKFERVGEELCQQIAKESFRHEHLKKRTHLSNKLSLILIAVVFFSFLSVAGALFLWQKKSYEAEVWKNTAETYFEQYNELKQKRLDDK